MKIGAFDTDREVLVIAEIGNNHEGSYALAEELIGRAAGAGAGAVKFQAIIPDKLVSPSDKARLAQLQRFQLRPEQLERLKVTADREGVLFLATPFALECVPFLNGLVPAFKIASGDNNFFPLLAAVAETGKPVLLSTGMTSLQEIDTAISFFQNAWKDFGIAPPPLAVLHCVVCYPTPPAEANLLAIRTLQQLTGVTVGYSDHTLGIEAAVLAAALGARIIEKHFTIDKNFSEFRDHQLSANPEELREMVERIGEGQLLLGDGGKRVMDCERESLPRVRRSIVAARPIAAGEVISWDDLNWVRLGHGLAPGAEGLLLGRRARSAIPAGEAILPAGLGEAD